MNMAAWDTLSVCKRLKIGGFSDVQAEAIAYELQDAAKEDHLVTRDFLRDRLREEFEKVEKRIKESELHMTIKMGSMFFALGSLMVGIKYLG